MTHLQIRTESSPVIVNLSSFMPQTKLSDQEFYEFCQTNQDLRIERSALGEIIIMPPAFSDTGNRNLKIAQQVANWADQDGTGETFDSSAGFTLPNGAMRSPDVSWIRSSRWNALSEAAKSSFSPICPDFVVELRSASDSLKSLQEKMLEYLENGLKLGLLIDRKNRNVHLYRPNQELQILENPEIVNCDPELAGFSLKMTQIW